jgi:predicted Rossmann fold nucleotide-binding protein DprA/Smf involved in DNA uptake
MYLLKLGFTKNLKKIRFSKLYSSKKRKKVLNEKETKKISRTSVNHTSLEKLKQAIEKRNSRLKLTTLKAVKCTRKMDR